MVPSQNELAKLSQRLDEASYASGHSFPKIELADFSKVVIILSSSRSGSSLLFQLLSDTGIFWSPMGEETPILRRAGLGWIRSTNESDAISRSVPDATSQYVRQCIFSDLGRLTSSPSDAHVSQATVRLICQWANREFNITKLIEAVRGTEDWSDLLSRLKLDSNFYDLTGVPSDRHSPLELPPWFVEVPPFVVPRARQLPNRTDLRSSPILLKTSTNSYRIPFLKALFPNRIQWIILTRNPASSINGLMDGWLSNAFHSHNMSGVAELKIKGYSDSQVSGDRWWKFDAPPGWSEYTCKPLPDVCAFQWYSGYLNILDQIQGSDSAVLVKHENLVDPSLSKQEFQKIFDFLGVQAKDPDVSKSRLVMGSATSGASRWRKRADLILPLLKSVEIGSIAERLGYELEQVNNWN